MPPVRIDKVWMHYNPHFDEVLAYFLLLKFGDKKYAGIPEANLLFGGAKDIGGKNEICLGFGGGEFDEHSSEYKDECCATLVAKCLGVESYPAVSYLLSFAIEADVRGNGHPFDIARVMKPLNRQRGPEATVWLILPIIKTLYEEQLDFWETKAALEKFGKSVEVGMGVERTIRIVVFKSDSSEAHKAAFSSGYGIAAIERSSGHVQIFPHNKAGIDPVPIVRLIRQNEQALVGTTYDKDELELPGALNGLPWFYHEASGLILNGSESVPDVPPTKLSLQRILEIITEGLVRQRRTSQYQYKKR